jgi:hypothetical protein
MRRGEMVLEIPMACKKSINPDCPHRVRARILRAGRMVAAAREWEGRHTGEITGRVAMWDLPDRDAVDTIRKRISRGSDSCWGYSFPVPTGTVELPARVSLDKGVEAAIEAIEFEKALRARDEIQTLMGSYAMFTNVRIADVRSTPLGALYGHMEITWEQMPAWIPTLLEVRLPKHRGGAFGLPTSDPRRRTCDDCAAEFDQGDRVGFDGVWTDGAFTYAGTYCVSARRRRLCSYHDVPTRPRYRKLGNTGKNKTRDDIIVSAGLEIVQTRSGSTESRSTPCRRARSVPNGPSQEDRPASRQNRGMTFEMRPLGEG